MLFRALARVVISASLILGGASITCAQDQNTVQDAVAEVQDQVLAGDKANSIPDQLSAYQSALDQYTYLELAKGGEDASDASVALATLNAAGVTSDSLRTSVLSATIADLQSGSPSAETRTAYWVAIPALVDQLQAPALKISALVDLASLVAKDDPTAALVYLHQGIEAADTISDEFEKNSALNAVAVAADGIADGAGARLVNSAIEAMWPARARGFARYVLASSKLGNTPLAEADTQELAAQVTQKLGADDIAGALQMALAIDTEADGARSEAINQVLQAALDKNEVALFPILATAYADNSDQESAIEKIIQNRIDTGRAVDAQQLADGLPAGPTKAKVQFLLANSFAEGGFDTMADTAFESGMAVSKDLSGTARDLALSEGIASAAALERFDIAETMVSELADPTSASSALRRLGKALSDDGQIAQAQTVLEKISNQEDRDYVNSGIATAQVKAGDLEAGLAVLENLTNANDQGRLAAEIVRTYARASDFTKAFALAETIRSAEYQVSAYVRLADAATDKQNAETAKTANTAALAVATAEADSKTRGELLTDVAESLAKSGDFNAASDAAALIDDPNQKTKALSLIAKAAADAGKVSDALEMVAALPPSATRDQDVAPALIRAAASADHLTEAAEAVRRFEDPFLRVKTFRAIALEQLTRLDTLEIGSGNGTSEDYLRKFTPSLTPASLTSPSAQTTVGGQSLYQMDTPKQTVASYGYPSLDVGVETIRRQLPAISRGKVAVTLAHLSPYNDKFFEDLAGGQTGLDYAGRAQGLLYPRVIVVQSGVYTLGMLIEELTDAGDYDLLNRQGDTVTLRAPLLVGEGATLILSGQEAKNYHLSVDAGSFIAVAGTLYVVDTTVSSWEETTNQPRLSDKEHRHEFRPFIIGWSGSHMYVGGSVLDSLGYAAPKSFGLSFSAGPKGLLENRGNLPAPTGIVVDNLFHNFEYGFYSYEAEDVVLVGNEYKDNVVYGIDPHDRSHRLLIGLNTAYGTKYKHGIIVSREVDGSWMLGNVSFDNAGSGFMLDRDSTDTLVYGNVAFDNKQDGLTLFESSCNIALSNHFFDNGRSGIKLRNSWDVSLLSNMLVGNGDAAIDGYTSKIEATSENRDFVLDPYVELTTFNADGNIIQGNKSGIKVNGVASYSLFNQAFRDQSGPLLGGDGRAFEGQMLRYSTSGTGVTVANACPVPKPDYYCGFRQSGLLGSDGQDLAYTPTPSCTPARADLDASVSAGDQS